MFSIGITVPKEVTIPEVMNTVNAMGWGTIYDSARTHALQNKDYIELHLKDVTAEGMSMNDQLKQGDVVFGEWKLSYTITLDEWKQMIEIHHQKRIERLKESLIKR